MSFWLKRRPVSLIHKHAAVLHKALEDAVQWGLLAANVCDRVDAPKQEKKQPRRWDAEQVRLFLGEMKRSLPHRLRARPSNPASYAGFQMVGREGREPPTPGLKARRSAR